MGRCHLDLSWTGEGEANPLAPFSPESSVPSTLIRQASQQGHKGAHGARLRTAWPSTVPLPGSRGPAIAASSQRDRRRNGSARRWLRVRQPYRLVSRLVLALCRSEGPCRAVEGPVPHDTAQLSPERERARPIRSRTLASSSS